VTTVSHSVLFSIHAHNIEQVEYLAHRHLFKIRLINIHDVSGLAGMVGRRPKSIVSSLLLSR